MDERIQVAARAIALQLGKAFPPDEILTEYTDVEVGDCYVYPWDLAKAAVKALDALINR